MTESRIDKIRNELNKLIVQSDEFELDLSLRNESWEEMFASRKLTKEQLAELKKSLENKFEKNYQSWFTQSAQVIKQVTPERFEEFIGLYQPDSKRRVADLLHYTIQDWLSGIRSGDDNWGEKVFDDFELTKQKFIMQRRILDSAYESLESSLRNIRGILQADIFDSEIEAARELLKNGFLRGAGVNCGVVIEKHLQESCQRHDIKITKKNPTINDLNDLLKIGSVYDVGDWRFIQRLGDLRNLCGHSKEREPTKEEVLELVDGTDKILKTVY